MHGFLFDAIITDLFVNIVFIRSHLIGVAIFMPWIKLNARTVINLQNIIYSMEV